MNVQEGTISSSPTNMLWPTTVGQDTFVDLSGSLSRENSISKIEGEKDKRDKEKNNKGAGENAESPEKPRESTDVMKDMRERIKMKTGVFRKHLTEYLKEMGSSTSSATFDMEDNSKCIVWDDKGRIKHATLIKLVEKLTSDKYADTQQIFVFLQTYRTFITPKKLLDLLITRYACLIPNKEYTPDEVEQYDKAVRRPIRLRVLVVIKYWIEQYFLDWDENPELDQTLREFMKSDVLPYGLTNLYEQILRILDKRIQEKQKVDIPANKYDPVSKFDITLFDFWSFPTKDIAIQLTLHEFSLFKAIKPYEFLGLAWTKKDGKKRAPDVLAAIAGFNKMVEWLRTEILVEENLKDRVARLAKILELANEFYKLNNFNGVVEVIATLESSSVARLRKTWAGLTTEQMDSFENLKKIVSQEKNFMKYREKLHRIEPPCVPYLGVYLTDLVFIDEGNADMYGEMVNFFKCGMISNAIREIQQYQVTKYIFTPVPLFQKYVEEFHGFNEKASYDLSLELEGRTSNSSAEDEFGDVATTPQQYIMYGRVKNKVLNYSEDPFDVQLLLLGSFSPITVRLPPKCNVQQALGIFENNLHGVNSGCSLVVHPRAQILDQFAFLSDYSGKKDIIVIQSDPQLIKVGISQSKTMQQISVIALDFSAPLFCMIPLFQITFNIKEEVAFLYIEGYAIARWLNIHKTIAEQACNASVGLILIYPLNNIIQKEPPKLDSVDKSGPLTIRQLNSKGFKFNVPKKRFVLLQDHFLLFCKPGQEATPYKALCLEHFKAKLGTDQTITLTRSFKGFSSTIVKSATIVLCAMPDEDISEWFFIMQRNCGIIGDQSVFGVDVSTAAGKRGKNVVIPLIVEKTLVYLFSGEKKWENLFNAPANPILLEYYKRLFDQGIDVEFSTSITDPYTVAQLLLAYLDELPAPLLSYELYDSFIVHGTKSFETEAETITELQHLVTKLPVVNKSVLCLLLLYLNESGTDRLGMGLALGPVLLKSGNICANINTKTNDDSKACGIVVMRLITHQEKIFAGAKEGAIARRILIRNRNNRPRKTSNPEYVELPPEATTGSSPPKTQKGIANTRKVSVAVCNERSASPTPLSQSQDISAKSLTDLNVNKTVLNRYLDLDVSINKDSAQEQQFRAVRTDSTSFPRTLPSRNRGDTEYLRNSTNSNSSSSSPSSSFNNSFTSHSSSTAIKHSSVTIPIPPSPTSAKRTNSESYVNEKMTMNINGITKEITSSTSLPEFPRSNSVHSSSSSSLSSIPMPPPPAPSSSRISSIGKHLSKLWHRDRSSKLVSSPSSTSISFSSLSPTSPPPPPFSATSPSPSPSLPVSNFTGEKVEERERNERAGIVMGNKGEREDRAKSPDIKVEKEEQIHKIDNETKIKEKEKENNEPAKDDPANKIEKKNKNEKDNKETKPLPIVEVVDSSVPRDSEHKEIPSERKTSNPTQPLPRKISNPLPQNQNTNQNTNQIMNQNATNQNLTQKPHNPINQQTQSIKTQQNQNTTQNNKTTNTITPQNQPKESNIKMRIARLENLSKEGDKSALDSPVLKKITNNTFCSQCGEKYISAEAKFCSACGHNRFC